MKIEYEKYELILAYLRQRPVVRFVLWVLALTVIPAFVIFGPVSDWLPKRTDRVIGKVSGKDVTVADLMDSMSGIKTQILLNYFHQPDTLDSFSKDRDLLAELGWKRLVLLNESKAYSINIKDSEVAAYIRSHPLFGSGGVFDPRRYHSVVRSHLGLQPQDFERLVKGNMAVQALKEIYSSGISVTDRESRMAYSMANEKIRISYVTIKPDDVKDTADIGEAEIKSYYEENKTAFILPDKSDAKVAGIAPLDDVREEIRKHLAESEKSESFQRRAEYLYGKIISEMDENGASFEDAALKFGLTAKESPLFSRSDKEIEGLNDPRAVMNLAFGMPEPGKISNPVQTSDGILIFRVVETEGFDRKKFAKERKLYKEKILENKKLNMLERKYSEMSLKTSLDIDLKDMARYYR